ncbi:hypothetical protein IW262DRAFT_1454999 [Armillaria fumosa]|nr:hypothetical protein IW262DRAFT_1454999 [Armillaria fumosa]
MSLHEIDGTSALDPRQDEAIAREDVEAGEPGTRRDGYGQYSTKEAAEEEDEAPVAAPPNSATAASTKKVFGMKRSTPTVKKGNDTYDYEQKYPEDAPYEEASSNARVWRTYEDESKNHDANMVEESRDNVDVLLVFAGLFSAVVTTFVAQTSQSLQPDYTAVSASLLYESVLVQRAIANSSSVDSIAPSPLNPTIAFVPAATDVWVNGLWFVSLFLSLTTALVAVLVKQWLHHYVALPSGTPRDRSFTRQFRYAGFQKWRVQVIIGLLPVFMHLALAIFLVGLVIFLQPLRQALSWTIGTGTGLVYTVYVVAAILPILSPQCPYRTPLCDLIYVAFCRFIPQVTWTWRKPFFLSGLKEGNFSRMYHNLPRILARKQQSLTTIESDSVQQTSTNLAADALHWLLSVSSNPTVQSIAMQSISGLPMASEERLLALRENIGAVDAASWRSLLGHATLQTKDSYCEPAPSMELKLGRLLRFYPHGFRRAYSFILTPDIDSFELTAAILCNGFTLYDGETLESVHPVTFFMDVARSSKLPPRCWYRLMNESHVLQPVDPNNDDPTNMVPLYLCSTVLHSFKFLQAGLTQGFDAPLVLHFEDALPYYLDKIYDRVLRMFVKFLKNPSLNDPSLPHSIRAFVAAIKFLLHRLSLPESNTSHTTIQKSLTEAIQWIHKQTLTSQEATAVMMVLEDIIAPSVVLPLNTESDWSKFRNDALHAYQSLAPDAPSACSLRGLRSIVDFIKSQWDNTAYLSYESDAACKVLTDLLAKRVPLASAAFLESECMEFFGSHTFHEASVPLVGEYVAGILEMKLKLDRIVDTATLQLHIDYLHNPLNLFTASSILATRGTRDMDRTAIHRDITTLVQLRPRDITWNECLKKLRDLVQGDGGDFFVQQHVWLRSASDQWEFPRLRTKEIQVEKDNISHAIQVLDDFFDGGARTGTGRWERFFGWRLRRKPEVKVEREQQV